MSEAVLTISNPSGLHARPAARFVEVATNFPCDITVKNLTTQSRSISAKSIIGILALGVEAGHEIQINTFGEGEETALQALVRLVMDELAKIDEADRAAYEN
jgi:phosphotransferase system HPr (HPr) family protein